MKSYLAVFALILSACLVQAQTSTPVAKSDSAAPTKDPVATSLRTMLPRRQNDTIAALEAMPADKFGYKPTTDQMTFAHLAAHIAESNNIECARVADVAEPKVDELKDTDSKDKLLAGVKASFAFCNDALAKMDDSKLGDTVEWFGGRKFPRAMVALFLSAGWADHYATAAMYLRMNGVLPPSAQPKK